MLEFTLWHFSKLFKLQQVQKNPASLALKNSMCQHTRKFLLKSGCVSVTRLGERAAAQAWLRFIAVTQAYEMHLSPLKSAQPCARSGSVAELQFLVHLLPALIDCVKYGYSSLGVPERRSTQNNCGALQSVSMCMIMMMMHRCMRLVG